MSGTEIQAILFERSTGKVMARLRNLDNALVTIGSILSIKLYAREKGKRSPALGLPSYSLTPSAVLFDELQTPANWTDKVDTLGFNFAHTADPATLPQDVRDIVHEYWFTPATGDEHLAVRVVIENRRSEKP